MAATTLELSTSIQGRISRLETNKVATKIRTKAGYYAKQWDYFHASLENIVFEKIITNRIKTALRVMDDEAKAYTHLNAMRRDYASGHKGTFNIMSTSAAEDLALDGNIWHIDDDNEYTEHPYPEPQKPYLLYVTGGGFILPPTRKQTKMVEKLATACGCTPVLGQHRLAPENPFPAACEDIADQYEKMIHTIAPEHIVLGADTAGASILLGALQILRERQLPLPSCMLLFSPWCDLSLSGWSYVTRSLSTASPFRMESAAFCARLYLQSTLATDPMASPIYADFDQFPRMLIHMSQHDMHFDDAVTLVEKAQKSNIHVKMNYWDTPRHHLERMSSRDANASFKMAAKFVTESQAFH